MFNLGISEIVLISIIALIFIGPKQLPEIARAIGKALNELKRASEDLTSSFTNPKNYIEHLQPKEEKQNITQHEMHLSHEYQESHHNSEANESESNGHTIEDKKEES